MRPKPFHLALFVAIAAGLAGASIAFANHGHGASFHGQNGETYTAHLTGYQETPSINSGGTADFTLTVGNNQLTFQLNYSNLSGNPTAAHVHVAQPGVAGGISFFLCGGGGKPACPSSTSGSISGTVAPGDIQAIAAQGFNAGDLASVISAIRAGVTYANIHTPSFPNGEIRGQIGSSSHGFGHGDDNDD